MISVRKYSDYYCFIKFDKAAYILYNIWSWWSAGGQHCFSRMKRKSVFGEIIWGNYVVILRLLFLIVTSFHPNLASLGFALNNAMNIMYLFDFKKNVWWILDISLQLLPHLHVFLWWWTIVGRNRKKQVSIRNTTTHF